MAVLHPCGTVPPVRVRERARSDSRRMPTVLAPALPALVLLALTIAATAEVPAAGTQPQLTRVEASVVCPDGAHPSEPVGRTTKPVSCRTWR